jgi:hypothetical protein
MREPLPLLALALAGALVGCNRHGAPADDTAKIALPPAGPSVAAGLWSQTVSDSHAPRETRYCLDPASAGALSALDTHLSKGCSRHDMAQASDGSWHFSTACDMGAWGKVTTAGVMKGDFASHYTVEADTQTVGAAQGGVNGPGRIKADVRRLGDCPADMKPGDVILPGGGKASVRSLGASA